MLAQWQHRRTTEKYPALMLLRTRLGNNPEIFLLTLTQLSINQLHLMTRGRYDVCRWMLSCLAFVLPASAAQQITVEIVNLEWTVRAGHNGSFHAKAILPDGAHVMLVCQAEGNLCSFST